MYVVVYKHVTQICARDVVSTWTKCDGHIYHGYLVIGKVSPLYNVFCKCIVVVYTTAGGNIGITSSTCMV